MEKQFMKLIGKVGIVFTLVLSLLVPITAFASSNQSFPKEVNGLPIIYIETEANTEGLSEGEAILVLLDPNSKTLRDSVDRLNFDQYLSSNPLPDNVSFTVVGGKGASQENFIKSHDETNSHVKQHGPVFVGGPGLLPVQTILTAVHPTFAIVQDTDPSWSQTIAAISAQWYAPYAGTSQTHWSAFMVNGVTNGTARPFVQCGHVFYSDGTGANIWSTTSITMKHSLSTASRTWKTIVMNSPSPMVVRVSVGGWGARIWATIFNISQMPELVAII